MNSCYMRGLRRILGTPRFSNKNDFSDRQVRDQLAQPSLDCILARSRLTYAARICRDKPLALIGLLHMRVGPQQLRLPWVRRLGEDVALLRQHLLLPTEWPDFFEDDAFWYHKMLQHQSWHTMVDSLFFTESICDADGAVHSGKVKAF
eukprot:6236048-Karenia_brevis.AAC.1